MNSRTEATKPRSTLRRVLNGLNRAAVHGIALPLLRLYRAVFSPVLSAVGSECRFYPSCSHYAEEAYRIHGFLRGTALTTVRVAKCNPLHPGGFDPVPGSDLERELRLREATANTTDSNHENSSAQKSVAANHSG